MIDLKSKTLLVVAPHPDDEVLGCGGLIKKVKNSGGKVYVLYLTVGATNDFTKSGISTESQRIAEIKKVARFLGFEDWHIAFQGDQYHLQLDLVSQRKLIHEIERGEKISLEAIKPDIIAFPFAGDYNQDHRVAAQACFAACRPAPKQAKFVPELILSYEQPMDSWSLEKERLSFFVELSTTEVNAKIEAMSLYASQVRGKGHFRSPEVLQALATIRGASIGTGFAEGFYAHKVKV